MNNKNAYVPGFLAVLTGGALAVGLSQIQPKEPPLQNVDPFPDSILTGVTTSECISLGNMPILQKIIRDGVEEIIVQPNSGVVLTNDRYDKPLVSEINGGGNLPQSRMQLRRNLAVTYKFQGEQWKALTQQKVFEILQNPEYLNFRLADGFCIYNKDLGWRAGKDPRETSPKYSPSQNLADSLNSGNLLIEPKRVIGR